MCRCTYPRILTASSVRLSTSHAKQSSAEGISLKSASMHAGHAVSVRDEVTSEYSLHGCDYKRGQLSCEVRTGRLLRDCGCQASPSSLLDLADVSC